MKNKEDTRTPEQLIVSSYMSHLGKVGGGRNKQKGSEYFKWVRSHRKPKVETTPASAEGEL